MSDLDKAIRKVENCNDEGVIPAEIYVQPVVDAARRFASLTSPETKQRVRRVFTHDFALHLDLSDSTIDELAEAVLRSVEEGTQ